MRRHPTSGFAAATTIALAAGALADRKPPPVTGAVDASLVIFAEPARGQSIVVVTPTVAGRVEATRWLTVAVDATVDAVSGATPRVYGAPDVVTAATPFDDTRVALGLRAAAAAGPFTGELGYHYGIEADYRAHTLSAAARLDLFGHNTALVARYAHGFDSTCDLDNGNLPTARRQSLGTSHGCFSSQAGLTAEPLAIDGAELSLTQTLTPRLVGALVGAWEHLDGFQSNPYRRVRLRLDGGVFEAQESHPRLRDRGSLGVRARFAATRRGAAGLDLRLYRDTWAIQSITVEGTWDQLLLDERLRLRVHARYYQQSRASFYRDAAEANAYEIAGPAGQYFTGDREMAPLADVLVGARLGWRPRPMGKRLARMFTAFEASLRLDLIKVIPFTPEPPNAPRMRGVVDAIIGGLSATGSF